MSDQISTPCFILDMTRLRANLDLDTHIRFLKTVKLSQIYRVVPKRVAHSATGRFGVITPSKGRA